MGRSSLNLNIRVLAAFSLLICTLCLASACNRNSGSPGEGPLKQITAFNGGQYEASGLVDVAGSDGVLFVDNKRVGHVFWMRLDQDGRQVGAVKDINLGVNAIDLEAVTFDETYFYTVSSQSRPKAAEGVNFVRFKFDHQKETVSEVATISGLKKFLIENVAELRDFGETKNKDGGLNIEGLAWDLRHQRFLLGLRSPVVDGQALLIPLKLRNPQGAFALENLEVEGSRAVRLPLGGLGIRGIEYNKRTNVYQIISGAAENQDQTDFGIWEWNGDIQQSVVRETKKIDKNLKPEGVARVTVGERDFTMVVFDASGYTMLD